MRKFIFILLGLFLSSSAFAQSADVISKILDSEEVTYGQVCYMSAVHQKLVGDKASYKEAVAALKKAGQILDDCDADTVALLEDVAQVVCKMWPEKNNSLMYKLTGGSKRYSYKVLKSQGIIRSNFDGKQKVSGRDFMNILTTAMMIYAPEEEGMTLEIQE